jgi:hypothetical protein
MEEGKLVRGSRKDNTCWIGTLFNMEEEKLVRGNNMEEEKYKMPSNSIGSDRNIGISAVS